MGAETRKTKGTGTKITAAHLAGLREAPKPESVIGAWDRSTAFVAGFALTALILPEISPIFGASQTAGAPHSAGGLLVLLVVIACFGIFPIVCLQHLYLQNVCAKQTAFKRLASVTLALAAMYFTTDAMKPIVGYQQKLTEDRLFAERAQPLPKSRVVTESNRAPASEDLSVYR